jgi:hypothetical protein
MDFANIYMDGRLLKYKNKIKVWLKFESPVHIYVMHL